MAFQVQPLLDAALAEIVDPLEAQIVTLQARVDELEILPPPDPHPVPTAFNTGFRGPLGNYTGPAISTTHDVTIANKQFSTTVGVTLNGANVAMKNIKVASTGVIGINAANAANFILEDATLTAPFKGAGTLLRCNITAAELTGASTLTDCYIPGGISGAGVAGSTIENTTVVP